LEPLADGAQQYLQSLVELYQKGGRELVYLFPESSLAYVESIQKGKSYPDALKAALTVWKGNDFVPGEAEDPYYALCFKNTDPFTEEFDALAVKLYEPLIQHQIQVK
jgi:exodeoxyribonuclease V gamma subunit